MLRNIQTKLKTFLNLLKVIEKVAKNTGNKEKLTSVKGVEVKSKIHKKTRTKEKEYS